MGIRDWFRRREPAPAEKRRFHQDRSAMFDLSRTAALEALLRIPREQRDDAWHDAFYDAAWFGSIALTEPQLFGGPDGFPYLRLNLPRDGERFEAQCLANLAPQCLETAVGAALFASPDDPPEAAQFVFSPGLLDSLIRYDSPGGDPIDAAEIALPSQGETFSVEKEGWSQSMTVEKTHDVLIGSPSSEYLPPHLAAGLYQFLTRAWDMEEPRVLLMVDTHMRPHRSLMVNRKRGDFAEEAHVDDSVRKLLWYLNPRRMVMLMPEHMTDDQMTPLRELFEGH